MGHCYKPYHNTSNKALEILRVDHTAMSYIYKVFDNTHMQWMGIWIHHHFIIEAGANPDVTTQHKSWVTATNHTITQAMRL